MNAHRVLLVASMIAAASVPHCVAGQSVAGQSTLVGTWRLVQATAWTASGNPELPLGPVPSGYVVFDASHHVFVQLTRPAASGDSVQAAASAAAFSAFFGTFEADHAGSGHLRIHVEGSNDATYIGTTQLRQFRVSGDTLVAGVPGKYELRLVRVSGTFR